MTIFKTFTIIEMSNDKVEILFKKINKAMEEAIKTGIDVVVKEQFCKDENGWWDSYTNPSSMICFSIESLIDKNLFNLEFITHASPLPNCEQNKKTVITFYEIYLILHKWKGIFNHQYNEYLKDRNKRFNKIEDYFPDFKVNRK